MIGLHSAQITLDNIQVTLIQVTPVPVTLVLALTLIQVTLKVKPQQRISYLTQVQNNTEFYVAVQRES